MNRNDDTAQRSSARTGSPYHGPNAWLAWCLATYCIIGPLYALAYADARIAAGHAIDDPRGILGLLSWTFTFYWELPLIAAFFICFAGYPRYLLLRIVSPVIVLGIGVLEFMFNHAIPWYARHHVPIWFNHAHGSVVVILSSLAIMVLFFYPEFVAPSAKPQ